MVFLPRSLNTRLILLVSGILLATGAMSGWLTARNQAGILKAAMRRNAEVMTTNLGDRCAYFLVLQDYAGLDAILSRSAGRADILQLQVCETDGTVVAAAGNRAAPENSRLGGEKRLTPPALAAPQSQMEKGELVVWQPIEAGHQIGWLRAAYDLNAVQRLERETWQSILRLSLLWVTVSTALLLLMLRPVTRGIGRLAQFARGLDAGKGAQLTIHPGSSEIAELGMALNYASTTLLATERELLRDRETLQEQYSTLRGIIESADAHIFSVDRQYRYTSFNTAHASVMRAIYGAEIQVGRSMLEFMTVPEDRDKAQNNLDRALAGERFVESAYSGEDARARLFFEVSHNPISAGDGPVIGVVVLSRDTTARKRAEEELRRLNRELRAVSKCNEVLMRAKEERKLLLDICRIICEEAGYLMAWVGYAENDSARSVRPVASAGADDGYLALAEITWADTERGRGPTGRAIRTGEIVCIQDFATDPTAAPWRENALRRGYRSSIALPLKDERANSFGALMIYSTDPQIFTPDEIRILAELGGDLAYGIMVLRVRAERQRTEEALRDSEENLRRLKDDLERRVAERTRELEQKNQELARMNKIFVGRELRMLELKERIRELEK